MAHSLGAYPVLVGAVSQKSPPVVVGGGCLIAPLAVGLPASLKAPQFVVAVEIPLMPPSVVGVALGVAPFVALRAVMEASSAIFPVVGLVAGLVAPLLAPVVVVVVASLGLPPGVVVVEDAPLVALLVAVGAILLVALPLVVVLASLGAPLVVMAEALLAAALVVAMDHLRDTPSVLDLGELGVGMVEPRYLVVAVATLVAREVPRLHQALHSGDLHLPLPEAR